MYLLIQIQISRIYKDKVYLLFMDPELEEKSFIKIKECENAILIIEEFLSIRGVLDILESKKNKYKTECLNIPATIASYRLFYIITRYLLPEDHKLILYYKLNISLLQYIMTDQYFINTCVNDKINILLTNGFSLDHGFVWYPKKIEDNSF